VDTFFAVGSPLGVFLALRNIRIGIGKSLLGFIYANFTLVIIFFLILLLNDDLAEEIALNRTEWKKKEFMRPTLKLWG